MKQFNAPGRHLCGLSWGRHSLWHADGKDDKIYEIDIDTGKVISSVDCPEIKTDVSWFQGGLFQITGNPKTISCIDLKTPNRLENISISPSYEHVCGLEVRENELWIAIEGEGRIERRDRLTGKIESQVETAKRIAGIAKTGDHIWYSDKTGSW